MEAKKYKSFRYTNNLTWDKARRGNTSAPGKPQMEIGSPPEFKGEPGVWCPEELLVAALNGCLMLTFISLAQSKGVQFVAYESTAEGLLENVDGKFLLSEVSVAPNVVLKSDHDLETGQDDHGPGRGALLHFQFHQGESEIGAAASRRRRDPEYAESLKR